MVVDSAESLLYFFFYFLVLIWLPLAADLNIEKVIACPIGITRAE